jgi:uncharacterized surface protein with fasciclin (FAS1) repeats
MLLAVFASVLNGCSKDASPTGPGTQPETGLLATASGDIVDTAIGAGSFNTLVAAVVAADLESTLRSEGPFTVFAPTDDAFARLPAGLVDKLLLPQNKEKLRELLLYHVVSGRILAGDLKWSQLVPTVEGDRLWVRKIWSKQIMVNNARVIARDVLATNGVIHVIDQVLIPQGFELELEQPTSDIVDTAIAAGAFNTLVTAVQAGDLVDDLRGAGPFTVFAPTDEAFSKLPPALLSALLLPENKAKLQELLLYHVVSARVLSKDLKFYQRVATLQDSKVTIVKWFGNVWVNFSKVTTADVLATNGVIHVIDRVLIPAGFTLNVNGTTMNAVALEELINARDAGELPPTETQMRDMLASE